MARSQTSELLEQLLDGERMTASQLDEFLARHVAEDLHLDYKHGDELKKAGSESARTIREYVSAFSNSAGGTLIVGVDDKTLEVTGCRAPGGQELEKWASRALTQLAAFLTPPPRTHVVEHKKGSVLIIAASRTPSLVPCIESGELRYYLRIHDQTLAVPPYLISDLMLGRREHPLLEVRPAFLDFTSTVVQGGRVCIWSARLGVSIGNIGLAVAHSIRVGLVTWSAFGGGGRLNSHLLSFIDAPEPQVRRESEPGLVHAESRSSGQSAYAPAIENIEPFVDNVYTVAGFSLPEAGVGLTWKAGLYVRSLSSPPVWYQLTGVMKQSDIHRSKEDRAQSLTLEQLGDHAQCSWA